MASLKQKTIYGFLWSFIQKIGVSGLGFLLLIVLARILTPEDFGLLAMLAIFIQVSERVIDAGFGQALIQKNNADDLDYSSVFWINISASLILYALIFISAPFIADFYAQEALTELLRMLSVVFVINAFSLVQETKIKKELRFKVLAIIHIPSIIFGGAVSLMMAYNDFGVWSLVGLQLSTRLFYSVQLWLYAKWYPKFKFRLDRIQALFSFGSRMFVSTMITVLYSNLITIIVGKYYSASQTGLYYNAKQMSMTPSGVIKSILDTVSFPALATIQNDNQKLKYAYRSIMQMLFFVMLPVFAFAAVLAEQLFSLVLGEQWVGAVPYFQLMCVIAVLSPLVNYNLNILKIKGEAKLFLRLQVLRRLITLAMLGISLYLSYGVIGLIAVECISYIGSFIVFSYISGKFIGYTMLEQIRDKFSSIVLTFLSVALVFGASSIWNLNEGVFELVILLLIGFGSYLLFAFLIKNEELNELKTTVNQLRDQKRA